MKLRTKVFDILLRVINEGAYSNLEIASALNGFTPAEKAFITRLVYGTIAYKIQADYIISKFSNKPIEKIDIEILIILESAIYQKFYMDSVPDYALISESVNLTRYCKKSSASGFVNGVLRQAVKYSLDLSDIPQNTAYYYSIKYSLEKEFCMLIMKQYGEYAEEIFAKSKSIPGFTARVNTLKVSMDEFLNNVDAFVCDVCPHVVKFNKGINVSQDEMFKKGYYYPQDEASALSAYVLNPKENDVVIDMCAAPGGKTTYLAGLMNNKGSILAFDLFSHKINIINETASRLGIDIIQAGVQDGAEYNSKYFEIADKILVDAPCSGYGIIRKKPELKFNTGNLPEIQLKILNNAAKYLKPGGELVYSTCTLNKEENIENVKRFLNENPNFELIDIDEFLNGKKFKVSGYGWVQILPGEYDMDGFFIAKLKKGE